MSEPLAMTNVGLSMKIPIVTTLQPDLFSWYSTIERHLNNMLTTDFSPKEL
jgi:hypothetical protein